MSALASVPTLEAALLPAPFLRAQSTVDNITVICLVIVKSVFCFCSSDVIAVVAATIASRAIIAL